MKNLIEKLKEQTQEFRTSFVTKCEYYATKEFTRLEKANAETREQWYKRFNVPTKNAKLQHGCIVQPFMLNRMSEEEKNALPDHVCVDYSDRTADKLNRKMEDARTACRRAVEAGSDAYVAKAIDDAHDYFDHSLAKLAFRLTEKGLLEGEEFSISSTFVNVNFNCTIDFHKVEGQFQNRLTAWTIIASGPIIKPHYRYLIK